MTTVHADVRHALRRWSARPGLVLTIILTLALGIGSTTAIFSVVDGVLLRPLPYTQPEHLVTTWVIFPQWRDRPALSALWDRVRLSLIDLRDLEASPALGSIGVWSEHRSALVDGESELVGAREISSGLLRTLGVRPFAGRTFTRQEEDAPSDAAMITYEAWQRRFGSDATIVGRRLVIDSAPRTIVGVMPKGFVVPGEQPELLLPLGTFNPRDRAVTNRNDANRLYQAIARIPNGVTVDATAAAVETILRAGKDKAIQTSRLESIDGLFFGTSRRPLLLLLAASGVLLLIACANVTGLLLGDAHARRGELAIRHALGASRWRLVRQLIRESGILAIGGGAVGIVAAWWLTPVLVSIAPAGLPRLDTVGLNARVLAFALVVSTMTTLAAATIPMLRRRTFDAGTSMQTGRATSERGHARDALVVAQVALAMVLVVGATLFGETVMRLTAQPLGFDSSRLVALRLPLQPAVAAEARARAREILLDRLRNTPGVEAAALVSAAPFAGNYSATGVEIDTRPGVNVTSRRFVVGDGYFRTMQMPLLRGRDFARADAGNEPVTIVSREFERRHFDSDAIGHRIRLNQIWMTVVGVVPDSKLRELTDATDPAFYVPLDQQPRLGAGEIVVRTRVDAAAMVPVLREAAIASKSVPALASIVDVDTLVSRTIAEQRYRAVISSAFGTSALVLAVVGLYGLLARRVAERRREIGVRMAVGAQPWRLVAHVSQHAGRLLVCGLVVGLPSSWGAATLIRSLLFGVEPSATHVFVFACSALVIAGALATVVPAVSASRVDPMVALRTET